MGRRVKRKQVEAGDGWTVVTHQAPSSSRQTESETEQLRSAKPEGIVEGLTVEKLVRDLRNREAKWEGAACARQMGDLVRARRWGVEKAVCIGIGSFSLDWEHRHRAMWQLVLFLGVVALLRESCPDSNVKLYAQEPIFTQLDVEFLAALDISVLPSDIETHISHSSFVFAPFVDWHLLLSTFLKGKDPVLYVGNKILDDYGTFANSEEKVKALEECDELGKVFTERRDCVKVEEFALHAHALNGLVVYWKNNEGEA